MPNFPGSLDSFTNPTGSTALAGAGQLLHSAEHATTNDILLALETKLGQNPAAADSLGYVYTGDGTNKGLWVPSGAMLSPGLLLNSNFDVWQKGGGATPAPTTQNTTTSYCADRFFVLPAGASVTVSLNSTTAPNSRSNCTLAVTGAVGVTTVDIGQRVRSRTILNQAKQSLVFSCWIFNNTGSAFTPTLLVNTPNALDNFAGTTVQLTQALQSCPNFAWTRVFHVFNPSAYTNINNGMQISVQIPSGALTAGTKAVLLGQFDLRPGNHLMEYYPPSAYLELLQCREYCQVLTSDSTYNAPFGAGHWYATTSGVAVVPLSGPMWTAPALTISATGHFAFLPANTVPITLTSGPTLSGVTKNALWLSGSVASGGILGDGTELVGVSGQPAQLTLVAEL